MKKTLLIMLLPITLFAQEHPNKHKTVVGKQYNQPTSSFWGVRDAEYFIVFDDGSSIKTSVGLFHCYEKGDSALFVWRFVAGTSDKKLGYYQMVNKCPQR